MQVTPGQRIPFWIKLKDGNPAAYVRAHLSNIDGSPFAGSPFSLTYSGNRGIYKANGPIMGSSILVSDYEVYSDSAYTNLDNRYLPYSDWVEPPGNSPNTQIEYILLNLPLVGIIQPTRICGSVACDVEAAGIIQRNIIMGFISTPLLTGSVSAQQVEDYL